MTKIRKVLLFVEGPEDTYFIRCYLKYLLKNSLNEDKVTTIKNKGRGNVKTDLKTSTLNLVIYDVNGKDSWATIKEIKKDYEFEGYESFIIFDTDSNTEKHDFKGGRENKIKLMEDKKKEVGKFDYFLFPFNNDKEGDLETLLLCLTNTDKQFFKQYKECYDKYCDCIKSKWGENIGYNELVEPKSIIFNYFQTMRGKEFGKPDKRNYLDTEMWVLDSENLEPLKIFFTETCKIV